MGRLAGKVAIVTGSSSGLGRAIGLAYVRERAKVVCADITLNARLEVEQETSATTVELIQKEHGTDTCIWAKTDVSSTEEMESLVQQAVSHFGRLDVYVSSTLNGAKKWECKVLTATECSIMLAFLLHRHYFTKPRKKRGIRCQCAFCVSRFEICHLTNAKAKTPS